LDDTAAITLEPLGKIRFKSNSVPEAMRSATSIAFRAAHLVLRAMTKPLRDSIPSNPETLRQEILAKHPVVNLESLLDWCWEAGLPVVHLPNLPAKKPQALCLRIKGRFVVFLCHGATSPAWQAFHLAHELGHICLGHLQEEGETEDSLCLDDTIKRDDLTEGEKQANTFAVALLLGSSEIKFTASDTNTARTLAPIVQTFAEENRLDPATVVLNVFHHDHSRTGRNMDTVKLLEGDKAAGLTIRQFVQQYLDFEVLSNEDDEFLQHLMKAV
jgi:Zn-dependent peptidase ImmA (M78 family)